MASYPIETVSSENDRLPRECASLTKIQPIFNPLFNPSLKIIAKLFIIQAGFSSPLPIRFSNTTCADQ